MIFFFNFQRVVLPKSLSNLYIFQYFLPKYLFFQWLLYLFLFYKPAQNHCIILFQGKSMNLGLLLLWDTQFPFLFSSSPVLSSALPYLLLTATTWKAQTSTILIVSLDLRGDVKSFKALFVDVAFYRRWWLGYKNIPRQFWTSTV